MPDPDVFALIAAGDAVRLRQVLAQDPRLARSRGPDGVSALLTALYRGRGDMARIVAEADYELDVFEAAALGEVEALQALLDDDSSAAGLYSPDGFTPLHLAAFFTRADAAALLVERGADVNAVTRNAMANRPLHAAAASRNFEISRLLLDASADPNARQQGGYTALHAAALHGDAALVDLLLMHGADPTIAADDGSRARDLAEQAGHHDLAARL